MTDVAKMSDLEITRLCAEAMGYEIDCSPYNGGGRDNTGFDILGRAVLNWHEGTTFAPLQDDADAMALVERFGLRSHVHNCLWTVIAGKSMEQTIFAAGQSTDLNRAICECVAKMQGERNDT